MPEIRCNSKSPPQGGWSLKMSAIAEAIEELEIEQTVYIRIGPVKGGLGQHDYKDGMHVVSISHANHRDYVSMVIWHELAHCMQSERHMKLNGYDFNKTYSFNNEIYNLNEYEREANKIMYLNREKSLIK
jgi:hypothetical protein